MKKPEKFDFSGAKEMTPDEMRAMKATDSGSGSEGTTIPVSVSRSGTGGTNPPPTPDPIPGGSGSGSGGDKLTPEKERERQRKACVGKGRGSGCSWEGSGGVILSGTCHPNYLTKEYYCADVFYAEPSSGTGGFEPKQAACLGREPDEKCSFIGSGGVAYSGKCVRPSQEISYDIPLLRCSDATGPKNKL